MGWGVEAECEDDDVEDEDEGVGQELVDELPAEAVSVRPNRTYGRYLLLLCGSTKR